ncbi:MAG: Hsp33 family molecular chaperone HslO [Proteobacteria bacterium]|nr:Hsp33 family molecular chaperone HslO [Pseudomonadota bacterium]
MEKQAGIILPFIFDNIPLRGKIVTLKNLEEFIPSIKTADKFVQELLKQCLSVVVLFQHDLKTKQSLTLQVISDSSIKLVIAQILADGSVRAYANISEENKINNFKKFAKTNPKIVMTVENDDNSYQSIIPVTKNTLKETFIDYYDKSVQNKTHLNFVEHKNTICTLMLQHTANEQLESEDWNRVKIMADSLKKDEIDKLSNLEMIQRLFAEDDLRTFKEETLEFYTTTDRARMEKTLKSLGVQQCSELLKSGDIEMVDQFSGLKENFTKDDIKEIFKYLNKGRTT